MTPEKELLEKRAGLNVQIEALETEVKGRALTDDENAKWEGMYDDLMVVNKEIDRGRKIRAQKALVAERAAVQNAVERGDIAPPDGEKMGQGGDTKAQYRKVYRKFMRSGFHRLNRDEQEVLSRGTDPQAVGTDALGGFTVPEEFGDELIKAMKAHGGMMEAGTIMRTSTGAAMPFPTVDERAVKGRRLSENAATAIKDVAFGSTSLNAYMYTSDEVRISLQLLQDNGVNLEQEISPILTDRIARIVNEEFTSGSGAGRPTGFLDDTTSAGTTAAVAGVTRNELLDLLYGVDSLYRRNGTWMFNDQTLKAIRKLNVGGTDDRPLWQVDIRGGHPALLEGKPFIINYDMPDLGAGNTPIAFGDFSKFRIRIVRDLTMVRFTEKYMNALQMGFSAFMRADAKLLDTNAIAKLTNAAS